MTAGTDTYEPTHKRPESRAQQEFERQVFTYPRDYWPERSGERNPRHARTLLRWVCALCGLIENSDLLVGPCARCGSVRFLSVSGR